MDDYYSILGVLPNDSSDTIKKAYRRLALTCHPDKGFSPEGFQKIQEAYSILSDEQKRANYDKIFLADDQVIANEIISFEEFDKHNGDDSYSYPCRCGGVFEIYQTEVDDKLDLVECSECSLICKILYD